MGRSPCCSKEGMNRGAWTAQEDQNLRDYIKAHGEGRWRNLPKKAGLKRCGKSCRLRWLNYLRPDIKRGNISPDEEELIIRLHKLLGNRWSLIAGRLPGRTDNEIKNYWNTNLCKKVENRQTQSPAHRKVSSQSSEKNLTNLEIKTSIDTTSQSPSKLKTMENKVLKTKAIKCTTNVSNNSACTQNSYQATDTGLVTGSKTENHPLIDTYTPLTSHQPNGISSVPNGENFDSDDFIMDFNIGELCLLSDLLNSDGLSDTQGLSYSNTTTNTSDLSPSSYHQPAIFCEEISQGWKYSEGVDNVNVKTDLQPLSPFFEYNGDDDEWLGYSNKFH